MDAASDLAPDRLIDSVALRAGASMVVLDGNLSTDVLAAALDDAISADVPVLIDPVSDPKALLLSPVLQPFRPVYVLTPNRTELAALTGLRVDTEAEIEAAVQNLFARGVQNVWVRLGEQGSIYCANDGTGTSLTAHPVTVRDVTGAGDAMAGAFVHALTAGRSPVEAARFAQAAAALTIASEHTVLPNLSVDLVEVELRRLGASY